MILTLSQFQKAVNKNIKDDMFDEPILVFNARDGKVICEARLKKTNDKVRVIKAYIKN